MKRFNKFFLLPVILSSMLCCHASCNQSQRNFYAVSVLFDYGDGTGFFFVGKSEEGIDSAFASDTVLQERIFSIWAKAFYDYHRSDLKCIVTPQAFDYLLSYLLDNCHTDLTKPITISTFTIRVYSPEGDRIGKYYYNDQLIKYFKNMMTYLKKSPYAEDYVPLTDKIKQYINDYKYYKHD